MPAGGICLAAARVMRWIAFARALNPLLLELDRDQSGRQTGSGAHRVGTAGGIGGAGVGVQSNCNFIPAIGTHIAISIPPLGPNINDWVPAIGWVLSIVGAIIFGRNTNTMADC